MSQRPIVTSWIAKSSIAISLALRNALLLSRSFGKIAIGSLATASFAMAFASPAMGQSAGDKSQYTIFNPTPRAQLRELSTDRPDKTESPYTVDAGHFQIETDLATFTDDRNTAGGQTVETKAVAVFVSNLKVGLTNAMDLQLVISPYQSETQKQTGLADTTGSGFGDTVVRLKYNLLGNDEGPIALALMPFLKIPTNNGDIGNKVVEGGLIFPIGLSLPGDWNMGLMLQLNRNKNGTDDGFHSEFVSTITASHDIAGKLGGYIEFFSASSAEAGSPWIATADTGFTYGLTSDLQLDAGINIGLTDAADDLNPFVGISARF